MGSQHQDVIEINGKKYDAVTGRMIKPADKATSPPPSVIKTAENRPNGVVLDGFMRKPKRPAGNRTVVHAKKPVQKSQTLMRSAVKKPAVVSKPKQVPHHIVTPKVGPRPHLVHAASSTKKNPLVSKFGEVQHRSSVVKKQAPLAVRPAPSTEARHMSKPAQTPSSQHATVRSKATSALIEKALASATSHEQPMHAAPSKKRRKKLAHRLGISPRAMAISVGILSGVLLGGFFAIQNVPNLSMRVAAARAGFDATMPGYKPTGFSFKGPIEYSDGWVTVSFRSNTDDRQYSVTQKESSWNSDALLANFVVAENKQYQTYIDRGRTMYIYDGSNATWVDNGVWYQIEGPSDMTTDQLVRIAASI